MQVTTRPGISSLPLRTRSLLPTGMLTEVRSPHPFRLTSKVSHSSGSERSLTSTCTGSEIRRRSLLRNWIVFADTRLAPDHQGVLRMPCPSLQSTKFSWPDRYQIGSCRVTKVTTYGRTATPRAVRNLLKTQAIDSGVCGRSYSSGVRLHPGLTIERVGRQDQCPLADAVGQGAGRRPKRREQA